MGPIEAGLAQRYRESRKNLWSLHPEFGHGASLRRMAEVEETIVEAEKFVERDVLNVATDQDDIPDALKWKFILAEVAQKHNVSVRDLCGPYRWRHYINARFEAFYRLRTETSMSLPQIGRHVGNRDHTTVINGIKKYKQRMGISD